jgi:hypothetical protein
MPRSVRLSLLLYAAHTRRRHHIFLIHRLESQWDGTADVCAQFPGRTSFGPADYRRSGGWRRTIPLKST